MDNKAKWKEGDILKLAMHSGIVQAGSIVRIIRVDLEGYHFVKLRDGGLPPIFQRTGIGIEVNITTKPPNLKAEYYETDDNAFTAIETEEWAAILQGTA